MEKHTAEWRRSKHLKPSEKAELERAAQMKDLAAEDYRRKVRMIKDRVIKRMRRADGKEN